MSLQNTSDVLRPSGRSLAWFIPGGTIGNINEADFMLSIRGEARTGDLLVIGAETIQPGSADVSRRSILSKYQEPEVRNFVMAPLRAAWHELKVGGDLEKAARRIKVDLVSNGKNRHSKIKGATTVELSLPSADNTFSRFLSGLRRFWAPDRSDAADDKIVLLTSTRYVETELISFICDYGLQHAGTVASPLNSSYKQFVFRFIPEPLEPEFHGSQGITLASNP